MRIVLSICLFSLALLALSFGIGHRLGGGGPTTPGGGSDSLVVAVHAEPTTQTLNPQLDQSAAGAAITPNIFEPLVTIDYGPDGQVSLVPKLAVSWRRLAASADIPRGLITAVVGPSGSGKSTFAKVLQGLTRPTEGDPRLRGGRH